jgi:excisionase family DNA binding protein
LPLEDVKRERKSSEPPAPTPAELLSTGEVARLFGVSPSAVTRWARTGAIKAIRTPGGHYRFRTSEISRAALAPDSEIDRPE